MRGDTKCGVNHRTFTLEPCAEGGGQGKMGETAAKASLVLADLE